MENSKEEMLKKLYEMKKELARKQKKLEKSKRAARVKAQVRQKIKEHEDQERQSACLESSVKDTCISKAPCMSFHKTSAEPAVSEKIIENSHTISISLNADVISTLPSATAVANKECSEMIDYLQHNHSVNIGIEEKIKSQCVNVDIDREKKALVKSQLQQTGWGNGEVQQDQMHNDKQQVPLHQQKAVKADMIMTGKRELDINSLQTTKVVSVGALNDSGVGEIRVCEKTDLNNGELSSEKLYTHKNGELNPILVGNSEDEAHNGKTFTKETENKDFRTRTKVWQDSFVDQVQKKQNQGTMKDKSSASLKVEEHPLKSGKNFWFDSEDFKLTNDQRKALESKQKSREQNAKLKNDPKTVIGNNGWLSAHKDKTMDRGQKKKSKSSKPHQTALSQHLNTGSRSKAASIKTLHKRENNGLVVPVEKSETWMKDCNLSLLRNTSPSNYEIDIDEKNSNKIVNEDTAFVNYKSSADESEQLSMMAATPQQRNAVKLNKCSSTADSDTDMCRVVNEGMVHHSIPIQSSSEPFANLQEEKSVSNVPVNHFKLNFEESSEKKNQRDLAATVVSKQSKVKEICSNKGFFDKNESTGTRNKKKTGGSFQTSESIKGESLEDRKIKRQQTNSESDEDVIRGSQWRQRKRCYGNDHQSKVERNSNPSTIVSDDSLSTTPSFKSLNGVPLDDFESTNTMKRKDALFNRRPESVSDSEFFNILGIPLNESKTYNGKKPISQEDRPTLLESKAKKQKFTENESDTDLLSGNAEQHVKEAQCLTLKMKPKSPEQMNSNKSERVGKVNSSSNNLYPSNSKFLNIQEPGPTNECKEDSEHYQSIVSNTDLNSLEPFSEYTELDAIPYSQFELTEDFLSEMSQSNNLKSEGFKERMRRGRVLVKRRSPRISSFDFLHSDNFSRNSSSLSSSALSSQTNSELEDKVAALVGVKPRRRSVAQQKKAAEVLSVFQYLIDQAKKADSVSEFELPREFFSFKCCLHDSETLKRVPFSFEAQSLKETDSTYNKSQSTETNCITDLNIPVEGLQYLSDTFNGNSERHLENVIVTKLEVAATSCMKVSSNSQRKEQFQNDLIDIDEMGCKEPNNTDRNECCDGQVGTSHDEKAKDANFTFKGTNKVLSKILDGETDMPGKNQDPEVKRIELEYESAWNVAKKSESSASPHFEHDEVGDFVSNNLPKELETSANKTCDESIISTSPCMGKNIGSLGSSSASTPISRRNRSRVRSGGNLSRKLFTASLERHTTLQSNTHGNFKNVFHVETKNIDRGTAALIEDFHENQGSGQSICGIAENSNTFYSDKLKAGCPSPDIQISNSGVTLCNTEAITPSKCNAQSPRTVCETPTTPVSHPFHSPSSPNSNGTSRSHPYNKEVYAITPNSMSMANPVTKLVSSANPVSVPLLSPVTPVHVNSSPRSLNFASAKRFSFTSTPKTSKSSSSGSISSKLQFDSSLMDNTVQEDNLKFVDSLYEPEEKTPETSVRVKKIRPLQNIRSTGFDFQPSQDHEQSKSLISNLETKDTEPGLGLTPNPTNNLSQILQAEESYLSPGQAAVNAPELTTLDSLNILEESLADSLKDCGDDLTSSSTRPTHVIAPWKIIPKTATTPVQVFEEKSTNYQEGVSVFTPSRRRSRSKTSRLDQSTDNQRKSLKFAGCFQSCSQDAVVSLLCGDFMTNNGGRTSFIVSVQATSLTVWTQDQEGGWQAELDWRLAPEIHIMKACLMPAVDCISIVASGWESGQLFVTVFIYDWHTEDTVRFNIPFMEEKIQLKNPTQVDLCPVSASELLLGITTNSHHTLGKVGLTKARRGVESFHVFQVHQGKLISLVVVEGMPTASVSLTADQSIVIWNTKHGIPLRTIKLAQTLPCLTQLICVRASKGLLLLDTLWRVENETCGGVLIANPSTGSVCKAMVYTVPNNSWRRAEKGKRRNNLILAINDGGSLGVWDSKSGMLLGHAKSNITTCASFMSTGSLMLGEIHGCLHIYHSNCPR